MIRVFVITVSAGGTGAQSAVLSSVVVLPASVGEGMILIGHGADKGLTGRTVAPVLMLSDASYRWSRRQIRKHVSPFDTGSWSGLAAVSGVATGDVSPAVTLHTSGTVQDGHAALSNKALSSLLCNYIV